MSNNSLKKSIAARLAQKRADRAAVKRSYEPRYDEVYWEGTAAMEQRMDNGELCALLEKKTEEDGKPPHVRLYIPYCVRADGCPERGLRLTVTASALRAMLINGEDSWEHDEASFVVEVIGRRVFVDVEVEVQDV